MRSKEAQGWTFALLGAGLDAYGEAGGLGYDARSVQAFAPDGTGAEIGLHQPLGQDDRPARQGAGAVSRSSPATSSRVTSPQRTTGGSVDPPERPPAEAYVLVAG